MPYRSGVRLLVLTLIAAAGLLGSAKAGTSTSAACPAVPPTTVSPTHSRLWTTNYHGAWSAAPDFVNPDGSMWLKAPWFASGPPGRPKAGPRGALSITGKRLDGPAPPLRAETREVGVLGYKGSGVWAAVLTFPTEGCWTITGRVERTRHTFRLMVTRA